MATGIYGFRSVERVDRILEVLRTTTHNGFPVFSLPTTSSAAPNTIVSAANAAAAAMTAIVSHDGSAAAAITNTTDSVECTRLEGLILRSQLLVLLQRRHFCDANGRPVGREFDEKQEIDLEVRFCLGVQSVLAGSWCAG